MLRVFTPVAFGSAAALVMPYTTVGSSGSASMVLTYHIISVNLRKSGEEGIRERIKKSTVRGQHMARGYLTRVEWIKGAEVRGSSDLNFGTKPFESSAIFPQVVFCIKFFLVLTVACNFH